MGYSFTDLGAEGCRRSLNALLFSLSISSLFLLLSLSTPFLFFVVVGINRSLSWFGIGRPTPSVLLHGQSSHHAITPSLVNCGDMGMIALRTSLSTKQTGTLNHGNILTDITVLLTHSNFTDTQECTGKFHVKNKYELCEYFVRKTAYCPWCAFNMKTIYHMIYCPLVTNSEMAVFMARKSLPYNSYTTHIITWPFLLFSWVDFSVL